MCCLLLWVGGVVNRWLWEVIKFVLKFIDELFNKILLSLI